MQIEDRCDIVSIKNNTEIHSAADNEAQRILTFSYDTPQVHIEGNDAAAAVINDHIALLDELYAAGAAPEDITLVFALGSHRGHTEAEKAHLAGERAWREITCVDLNVEDCVHIGTTSRGTPVDIDRRVAEADRRICLGNIEYHYFAGYSGGAKAIMPGVSTRAAIQANHSRMVESAACAGHLKGNPVREDIEEAAAMVGVDFILNGVLDAHK